MKSKIKSTSFWDEIMKGHKWTILVMSLLMFILYPITLLINFEGYTGYSYSETQILEWLRNYFVYEDTYMNVFCFSYLGYVYLYLTLALGAALGVAAFSYLHNRTKVGLFHSIPVTRHKIIVTKISTATVTFVLPLLVSMLMYLAIICTRSYFTWQLLGRMGIFFAYNLLFFWMGYLLAAIAMLLTGKVLIGVFGALTFGFYMPVVAMILTGMVELFLFTFKISYNDIWGPFRWIMQVSPVYFLQTIAWDSLYYVLVTIGILMVLWGIHCFLMRIRPMETAERAMSYTTIGDIIKVAIVVPSSFGIGLLFYGITYSSILWFYFGTIFGFMVTYLVMQFLYGVEIRDVLKQKKQILLIASIIFVCVTIFANDIFGYDSYQPDYEDIEDINIVFEEPYEYNSDIMNLGLMEVHMGKSEETYDFVSNLISEAKEYVTSDSDADWDELRTFDVEYILENGKVVQRSYTVELDNEMVEGMKHLWTNEEFLDVRYPIRVFDVKNIGSIYIDECYDYDLCYDMLFESDRASQVEFIEAYKADMLAFDSDNLGEFPLASGSFYLNMQAQRLGDGSYYTYQGYFTFTIYPSSTNTLEFLESKGYSLKLGWELEDVESIKVEDIIDGNITYFTEEDIQVLLEELVSYRLIDSFCKVEEGRTAEVNMKEDYYSNYAYFVK